jgi:hypothetical protein
MYELNGKKITADKVKKQRDELEGVYVYNSLILIDGKKVAHVGDGMMGAGFTEYEVYDAKAYKELKEEIEALGLDFEEFWFSELVELANLLKEYGKSKKNKVMFRRRDDVQRYIREVKFRGNELEDVMRFIYETHGKDNVVIAHIDTEEFIKGVR